MLVYHHHPVTGVFLNTSSEADESPLEPGVFLIPAHATEQVPPSVGDPKKQHAVFRDGCWCIETIPVPPRIRTNYEKMPIEGMFKRISIKEALKGGVT